MNTRHRERSPRRIPFDASGILRMYGDYRLGNIPLETIHISSLKDDKNEVTGYYKCLAAASLAPEKGAAGAAA